MLLLFKNLLYYTYYFTLFLPLTMTPHFNRGRWWPILCPTSGALRNFLKGLNHKSSIYHDSGINLSSVAHQLTHGTLSYSSSRGFIWYCTQIWGINLVSICIILKMWHSPPMTWGTRMCLYVFWLVNKFHNWLAGSKNTAYVLKPSFVLQDKLIYHENSCFVY